MKKVVALMLSIIFLFSPIATVVAMDEETPSGIPLAEIETFIDNYMVEYIGKSAPGAAVVLVNRGEIIFSKGYGYANMEKGVPVDSRETVFEYGSVSKLFVYTTIMKLVEEGKIDLTADIRKYLPPGFLKKVTYDEPITMLHVMSHTTGFEDYLFDVILPSADDIPALEEVLRRDQPRQVYEPGTISGYSNYAVALAAYIAEQMTGQDFYQYLMETVFLPLAMNSTSAHITLADKPELLAKKAYGYLPTQDEGFTVGSWSHVVPYPAGSVTGTAEDLARFAMALMPEEGQRSPLFTKRATLDEMLTQSYPMGPGLTGFAHGFIEWDGEYRGVGHGGNTIAFTSQINLIPETRFGVVVLTNAAGDMDISSGLTEALIGKRKPDMPVVTDNLPPASEVEGTYITARRMHYGFLKLHGYLSLLTVRALDANKIELSMGKETSTLVQTEPHLYQRVEATGKLFNSHFNPVYFEVENGQVKRMSGDFLPLPSGHTVPWLVASALLTIVAVLYLIITPLILQLGKLLHKKDDVTALSANVRMQKLASLLLLTGTAIVLNNIVLVVRMLINNYRSFSEVRLQVLLNYPLATVAAVLSIVLIININRATCTKKQKIFYWTTVSVIVVFVGILAKWQFFTLLA